MYQSTVPYLAGAQGFRTPFCAASRPSLLAVKAQNKQAARRFAPTLAGVLLPRYSIKIKREELHSSLLILWLATEIDDITFCFQIQSFSLRYQELQ